MIQAFEKCYQVKYIKIKVLFIRIKQSMEVRSVVLFFDLLSKWCYCNCLVNTES